MLSKRKQDILLLCISLFIALLLAEFVLRLLKVMPPRLAASARYNVHEINSNLKLLYTLRPNAVKQTRGIINKINSGGFRDREYPIERDYSKKRILFLGDSITYGLAVQAEDSLPKRLENVFSRNAKPTEVLNFGVSGYDTEQEVEFLKKSGLKYKPDIVIVEYALNDVRYASLELDKLSEMSGSSVLESGQNPVKNILTFLYDHSYLLSFINQRFKLQKRVKELKSYRSPLWEYIAERNDQIRDLENSPYKQLKAAVIQDAKELGTSDDALKNMLEATGLQTVSDIGRSHWNYAKSSFLDLQQLSKQHNFKVVVVIIPYFMELNKYALKSVHAFLKNEFESMGFPTIDLFQRCVNFDTLQTDTISGDRTHLTPDGAEMMATYIYNELNKMEGLGEPN